MGGWGEQNWEMKSRDMAKAAHLGVIFLVQFMSFSPLSLACFHGSENFGYRGDIGPSHWASLSPAFSACQQGRHQSPIDISTQHLLPNPTLGPLIQMYRPSNATLVNNGFNVALRFDGDAGELVVDGQKYALKQMHWHFSSEHTIDSHRFAAELHMVHTNDKGNITVVAVLYRFGSRPDPLLLSIRNQLLELKKDACVLPPKTEIPVGVLQPAKHPPMPMKYFRYIGSLTAPPCSENVIWSVLAEVKEMMPEQADAVRAPLDKDYRRNARPTQPLNGRTVEVFVEG